MVLPSQQDFERRLTDFLSDPTPTGVSYCDWASWIFQLRSAVGPEHVNCLLLEDMSTREYWQTAAALFGAETSTPPKQVANALKVAEDEWALRDLIPVQQVILTGSYLVQQSLCQMNCVNG
jgi:hypothetical protein